MFESWHFLAGFAASLLLCLILIESLRGAAGRLGLVDRPGGRHAHPGPVPLIGGIAIFLSITICTLAFAAWSREGLTGGSDAEGFVTILAGASAIHLLGIADDRWHLPAHTKFLVQALVAVACFWGGIRLGGIQVPGVGLVEFGLPLSLVITVIWLVGITNAFNLVDGTDGLAAGAGLAATLSMFVVSVVFGHELAALILALAAGALLGFLRSNFPPASVYLGDSGSLYLGFLLASLGIVSSTKAATVVAIAIPVLAVGLPVLDTTLAAARRFIVGHAISRPDRRHIHHRLLDHGYSPRQVILVLWGVSAIFGLASMLLAVEAARLAAFVLIVIAVSLGVVIHRLRLPELLELRGTLGRGLAQRQVMSRNLAIRVGAERVSRATSVPALIEELSTALREASLDEAEMWLSSGFVAPASVAASSGVVIDGDGSLWRWGGTSADGARFRCWEVTLPVLSDRGVQVGRLTVRRPIATEMPRDLFLLHDRLMPELVSALERLCAREWSGPLEGRSRVRLPGLIEGRAE